MLLFKRPARRNKRTGITLAGLGYRILFLLALFLAGPVAAIGLTDPPLLVHSHDNRNTYKLTDIDSCRESGKIQAVGTVTLYADDLSPVKLVEWIVSISIDPSTGAATQEILCRMWPDIDASIDNVEPAVVAMSTSYVIMWQLPSTMDLYLAHVLYGATHVEQYSKTDTSPSAFTLHKITLPTAYQSNWQVGHAGSDYIGIIGTAASAPLWFTSIEANRGGSGHVCEVTQTGSSSAYASSISGTDDGKFTIGGAWNDRPSFLELAAADCSFTTDLGVQLEPATSFPNYHFAAMDKFGESTYSAIARQNDASTAISSVVIFYVVDDRT